MPAVGALCKVNGDLQNSHIIPEFFYRLIYDAQPRRFHVVSAILSERESFQQKGLRERLLCRACEQKFGRWEHYAKAAFVDTRGVTITRHKDRITFHNLDYQQFKLFQLSLLWRMGVSTLPFFNDVALGPHEEKLRLALLREDPLQPDQYPCWLVAVEMRGKLLRDWILEPSLIRLDGHHIYWLVITSIMFSFYVGSQPPPTAIMPLFLNKRNEMVVIVRDITDIPCLADTVQRLGTAINARKKSK
jgi:hypothetical protein